MQTLNLKEKKILSKIQKSLDLEGYAPTVRELAEYIGAESPRAAGYYLDQLERKGYIHRTKDSSRNIALITGKEGESLSDVVRVPLVGWTAGGTAIWSEQNIEEWIPVSRRFFKHGGDDIFLVKVKGNSMSPEIESGDMIIVKKQYTANSGEVVLALIGDDTTVKKYVPREDHILLQPINPDYEPILVFPDEVRIQGVIQGVLKYY
jgi:repressor LexA